MIDYSQNVSDNINKYFCTIDFRKSSLIIINRVELVRKNVCDILYYIYMILRKNYRNVVKILFRKS